MIADATLCIAHVREVDEEGAACRKSRLVILQFVHGQVQGSVGQSAFALVDRDGQLCHSQKTSIWC